MYGNKYEYQECFFKTINPKDFDSDDYLSLKDADEQIFQFEKEEGINVHEDNKRAIQTGWD